MTTISNTVAQYRCQRTGTVYSQITSTGSLLYISQLYSVLPPSQNSCPTSSLNRENSGIAPKRHTIRNLLNEHYPSMYMM